MSSGTGRASRAGGRALGAVLVALLGSTAAHAGAQPRSGASQHGSTVVKAKIRSVDRPRSFWTARRMRRAPALPLLHPAAGVPKAAEPQGQEPPSWVPPARPGAEAAPALRSGRVANASAAKVAGSARTASRAFPNSANGVVYGEYEIDGRGELYRCSGSVINTRAGNVVLTAGHCVIDPDSGARARNLIFVPGYRNGSEPFGEWPAAKFATTARWRNTAGSRNPDEAGDVAMLTLRDRRSDGATVRQVVGALGIGFHQPRDRTYNEYGYPAAKPYDGSTLYVVRSRYAGADRSFTPAPLGIVSDFTGGSSGGPWMVGSPPVVLSVTDYSYTYPRSLRGYMFGPYFGGVAQDLYWAVGGSGAGSRSSSPTG